MGARRGENVSDPYVGEIKIWAFPWAPQGWALCDGSILNATQNQALYSLIGVTFGGQVGKTFGLPDLRGRTPLGTDPNGTRSGIQYSTGNQGGLEAVTLTLAMVPPHTHSVIAVPVNGTAPAPTGNALANVVPTVANNPTNFATYLPQANWTADTTLVPDTVATSGANAPHQNMQPFAVTNFTICMSGNYPPRN